MYATRWNSAALIFMMNHKERKIMDRVFAKLYETEVGQILVKIDEDDCVPECRIFFQPEGFGVC